jgi:hypothetical protein
MLKKNRSAPNTAVIPVLYYPDVREAVEWLTTALPFTERLRIADHRCQLAHSNGAVVVAKPGGHVNAARSFNIAEPRSALRHASCHGDRRTLWTRQGSRARVLAGPADHMYGERQCSFLDR